MNFATPAPARAERPTSLTTVLSEYVDRKNVVPISLVTLLGVGAGDYITGVDITFTLLYLAPITLGVWFRGRRFGIALALTAAFFGFATSIVSTGRRFSFGTAIWNQVGTLGVFLAIVFLLDMLHAFLEDERRKHGLAIEQLRHAERLNVIGTLAAGVAHELGTPLQAITGNAELFESRPLTEENAHRYSRAILAQVTRMTEIISHLLDFGRRGGSDRQLTDLRQLTEKAASLLRPMTRGRCRVVCEPGTAEALALVNPGEIEQVLANLILNAIQATPSGGEVRVRCEVDESDREGPSASLVVEDEGSGIRPSDLPRIFDPFFTTKGVGTGTGLGLSVSYGIVEDHKGSISVKSEIGWGSRFVVRLPLNA